MRTRTRAPRDARRTHARTVWMRGKRMPSTDMPATRQAQVPVRTSGSASAARPTAGKTMKSEERSAWKAMGKENMTTNAMKSRAVSTK